MAKIKICVTGGNGFIGRNISDLFREKYQLTALTRRELNLLDEDQVKTFFKNRHFDVVINAAAMGVKRSQTTNSTTNFLEQNLRIFLNLIKQKKRFDRMIQLGSGAEYDKSRPLKKVSEAEFGRHIPVDQYGLSKYLCSKIAETEPKVLTLRLFALFGEHEDYQTRLISNLICRYIFKQPLTINQNAYFDYLDIRDFLQILDFFINHPPKSQTINIGRGKSVALKSLAKKINKLSDYQLPIEIKKPGLANEYSPKIELLKKSLPNFSPLNLDDSIQRLYLWYKNNTAWQKDFGS